MIRKAGRRGRKGVDGEIVKFDEVGLFADYNESVSWFARIARGERGCMKSAQDLPIQHNQREEKKRKVWSTYDAAG